MKIEVSLKFNAKAAMRRLEEIYEREINDLCDVVLEHARINVGGIYPDVAATLRSGLVGMAAQGVIEGSISAWHWEAFLAEWGSGSMMDPTNPDLYKYMASPFWNPARTGLAIVGRPAGPYMGLDGHMHTKHTGYLEGVNLEELSRNDPFFLAWMHSVGLPDDAFQPKRPLHFMREAILANKNLIIDQLQAVIERFDFGDFFV